MILYYSLIYRNTIHKNTIQLITIQYNVPCAENQLFSRLLALQNFLGLNNKSGGFKCQSFGSLMFSGKNSWIVALRPGLES